MISSKVEVTNMIDDGEAFANELHDVIEDQVIINLLFIN
jgi:hypothetical protein